MLDVTLKFVNQYFLVTLNSNHPIVMKNPQIPDLIFIVLLAIILIILNEFQVITFTSYKYVYIALLSTYFIGRKVSLVLNQKK